MRHSFQEEHSLRDWFKNEEEAEDDDRRKTQQEEAEAEKKSDAFNKKVTELGLKEEVSARDGKPAEKGTRVALYISWKLVRELRIAKSSATQEGDAGRIEGYVVSVVSHQVRAKRPREDVLGTFVDYVQVRVRTKDPKGSTERDRSIDFCAEDLLYNAAGEPRIEKLLDTPKK